MYWVLYDSIHIYSYELLLEIGIWGKIECRTAPFKDMQVRPFNAAIWHDNTLLNIVVLSRSGIILALII